MSMRSSLQCVTRSQSKLANIMHKSELKTS